MRRLVTAFWLFYVALPLLVAATQRDPFDCCRAEAGHGCFLRKRAPAGQPALAAAGERCAVAAAKATQEPQVALAGVSTSARPEIRSALLSVAPSAVRGIAREIASARAPPRRA